MIEIDLAHPDSPITVVDQEESRPGALRSRKLPWCPKENWLIGPPGINTWGSSGVNRLGACVGTPRHLWSQLSWESDPWNLNLGGHSLFQCGPLQTGHGAGGILLEMPFLPTGITSLSPFTWVPLGVFLRLFQSRSNSHCWGISLLPGSFFRIFILIFSAITYCLSQLQQFF